MKHIVKINEFVNRGEIYSLIEKAECTPLSDLTAVANTESYKKVISYGKIVIPYLIERNSIIWDRGLSELTGQGLNPSEYTTSERVDYWKKWAIENGYQK